MSSWDEAEVAFFFFFFWRGNRALSAVQEEDDIKAEEGAPGAGPFFHGYFSASCLCSTLEGHYAPVSELGRGKENKKKAGSSCSHGVYNLVLLTTRKL